MKLKEFFNDVKTIAFPVLAISLVMLIGILVLNVLQKTQEPQIIKDCTTICESNNYNYYNYTRTGYGGSTKVCYCKSDDGRLNTYII